VRYSLWLTPYWRWGSLDAIGRAAQRAEEIGFSSISIADHIICPTGPDGDVVTPVWYDFFVLATHIANRTRRIRLVGTLVLPYRNPLFMAKQIASLDVVSGGRFTLVAAVGWLRQEFDLLGIPYSERGAITDEYLRAIKILWIEDRPEFAGKYSRFSDIVFEPKCVQRPHVPIWIGGSGPRAIERLLNYGDGWMPVGGDLTPELSATVRMIKEQALARGRDPNALEVRYNLAIGESDPAVRAVSHNIKVADAGAIAEVIDELKAAGFTELCFYFGWETPSDYLERIEWFASEVMPIVS
jgi:probable F420-dependent oxidoreductase